VLVVTAASNVRSNLRLVAFVGTATGVASTDSIFSANLVRRGTALASRVRRRIALANTVRRFAALTG